MGNDGRRVELRFRPGFGFGNDEYAWRDILFGQPLKDWPAFDVRQARPKQGSGHLGDRGDRSPFRIAFQSASTPSHVAKCHSIRAFSIKSRIRLSASSLVAMMSDSSGTRASLHKRFSFSDLSHVRLPRLDCALVSHPQKAAPSAGAAKHARAGSPITARS